MLVPGSPGHRETRPGGLSETAEDGQIQAIKGTKFSLIAKNFLKIGVEGIESAVLRGPDPTISAESDLPFAFSLTKRSMMAEKRFA